MELTNERREAELKTVFTLKVRDDEIHKAITPEKLIPEVTSRLAIGIVDMLMEKIAPAIATALSEKGITIPPQPQVQRRVRWLQAETCTSPQWEVARESKLAQEGDMILVWVNQGDILSMGEEVS